MADMGFDCHCGWEGPNRQAAAQHWLETGHDAMCGGVLYSEWEATQCHGPFGKCARVADLETRWRSRVADIEYERDELVRDVCARLEEIAALRAAIENYLLWQPGRRGHAAAHRELQAALPTTPEREKADG